MSDSSPWLTLQQDTKPVLENVVLRRLRVVEGRVVDARGESVVGATVRQSGDGPVPTETETDANGQFRLPGVLAEPAFVFVEKKGFRFQGRSIGADSSSMEFDDLAHGRTLRASDNAPRGTIPRRGAQTGSDALRSLRRSGDRAGVAEREMAGLFDTGQARSGPCVDVLGRKDFAADLEPLGFRRGEVAVELMKTSPGGGPHADRGHP